ncbi:hypothetical protein ACJRO7_035562 [Eucalyptus globulus]|uniref:Uncharacterized protein n=1 Tax=Eucalyptus globulus TaxID=34317 RepID=A0ABD3J6C4_EUCGL
MHLNLSKALLLSYLSTVALSCEPVPGELNATPPPECRIAYQQLELELVAASNGYNIYNNLQPDPAGCGRGTTNGARYTGCVPPPNPVPKCDIYNRNYPRC